MWILIVPIYRYLQLFENVLNFKLNVKEMYTCCTNRYLFYFTLKIKTGCMNKGQVLTIK